LFDIRKSGDELPTQFTDALIQMHERDAIEIEAKLDGKTQKAALAKKAYLKAKVGGVSADEYTWGDVNLKTDYWEVTTYRDLVQPNKVTIVTVN
jgi:hypothetical protein